MRAIILTTIIMIVTAIASPAMANDLALPECYSPYTRLVVENGRAAQAGNDYPTGTAYTNGDYMVHAVADGTITVQVTEDGTAVGNVQTGTELTITGSANADLAITVTAAASGTRFRVAADVTGDSDAAKCSGQKPTGQPTTEPAAAEENDTESFTPPSEESDPAAAPEEQPTGEEPNGYPTGQTGSATTAESIRFERLAGDTRITTAIRVNSEAADLAEHAVLFNAGNSVDGLLAAYAAGAVDGQVLPTNGETLSADTADRLEYAGVRTVTLIGDTTDLSTQVEDDVRDLGITVTRHAGHDIYETAAAVNRATMPNGIGTFADDKTAVVFNANALADAVTASAAAYGSQFPMVPVRKDEITDPSARFLTDAGIKRVIVLGGTAVVGPDTITAIRDMGINVTQTAGATRTETAAMFRTLLTQRAGYSPDCVVLARGDNPVDAITAAPLAGGRHCPILLTANPTVLSRETLESVQDDTPEVIYVTGGTAAVSDDLLTELADQAS